MVFWPPPPLSLVLLEPDLLEPPHPAAASATSVTGTATTTTPLMSPPLGGRQALRRGRGRRIRLRLRNDPDVRLRRFPVPEELLRLVVRDRPGDDHVLALVPVDRGRHLVARRQLQGIDHADDLVEVAP